MKPALTCSEFLDRSGKVKKYSYRWAEGIVELLCQKYPRVSEDVFHLLKIDRRILANILAQGRPEYPIIRDIMHSYDSWLGRGCFKQNTTHALSDFLRMWARKCHGSLSEYLTCLSGGLIMEEQVSKAGDAEVITEASLPSTPDEV